jgi:hypothetical protein
MAVTSAGSVFAGPIILGGDDLNEHGSFSAGSNQLGWLYIENALSAIDAQVTLPGTFTVDVVELGHPTADPALTSAAAALGLTTTAYSGAAGLTQFFADLAAGIVRPRILYSPGTDYFAASLDSFESAVLAANANAINDFVAAGGGLMSHGGANTTAYSYLTALLPGIIMSTACNASGATLTAAGQAAFPQVTAADVQAGPCHGSFSGNLGGLVPLALDGDGRFMIIGGVGGSITDPPGDVPEPSSMLLLAAGFASLAVRRRKAAR